MKPKVIKTEREYKAALERIETLWDARPGSTGADELELWAALVNAYEDERHPIPAPDPVEAIRFRMDQMGLKAADLAGILGGRNRVSEVLNRKRAISTAMMRNLCIKLGIPAESLLGVPGSAISKVNERQAPYSIRSQPRR